MVKTTKQLSLWEAAKGFVSLQKLADCPARFLLSADLASYLPQSSWLAGGKGKGELGGF